jgi:hypothetical protein
VIITLSLGESMFSPALSASVVLLAGTVMATPPDQQPEGQSTALPWQVTQDPFNRPEFYARLSPGQKAFRDRRNAARIAGAAKDRSTAPSETRGGSTAKVSTTPHPETVVPRIPAGDGQIFQGTQVCSDFSRGSDFSPWNVWVGSVNGQTWVICAGSSVKEPTKGMMMAHLAAPAGRKQAPIYVGAPTATGRLELVGGTAHTLTVKTATGALRYFDAATLSFVEQPS